MESYSVDDVALWLFCQGMGETAIAAFRGNDIDGGMLLTLTQDELVNDLGLTRLQAKKVLRSNEFTSEVIGMDPRDVQELKEQIARLEKENGDLKETLAKHGTAPSDTTMIPVTTAVPITTTYVNHRGRTNHHRVYRPVQPNHHTTYSTYQPTPTYIPTAPATAPTNSTNYYSTENASPYVPNTANSKPSKTANVAKGAVTGAAGGAVTGAMKGAIVGAIVPGVSAGEGAKAGAAAGAATGGMKGIVRAALR